MNREQNMAEKNCILKVLTGSYVYGTNNENSDYDIRGVFIADEEYILGLHKIEHVKFEDEDYELFEFRKFINLAMDNNPNILELLFVPNDNILLFNNYGTELISKRKEFLHQGLIEKFLAYSRSQKHKMFIKKENLKILEETIIFLEKEKNNFKFLNEIKHKNIKDEKYFYKIADLNFKKNCKIFKSIQIIKNRLGKISKRTKTGHEIYDTKFAMHLIRLLYECMDFIAFQEIKFPFIGERLEILLEIRNGEWTKDEIYNYSEYLEKEIEKLIPYTKLSKHKNFDLMEKYVINTLKKWYNIK